MDGSEPGTAPTPHDFARELSALSPAELLLLLASLDSTQRAALRRFLPFDCRCPIRLPDCPEHAPAPCDCRIPPEPCRHIVAAQAEDWPLPITAVAYLLALEAPREFTTPPPPGKPSRNTNPRAQVAVMAERHARGRRLRHPRDWLGLGLQGVDERLTRKLGRLRNGADAPGPLTME